MLLKGVCPAFFYGSQKIVTQKNMNFSQKGIYNWCKKVYHILV